MGTERTGQRSSGSKAEWEESWAPAAKISHRPGSRAASRGIQHQTEAGYAHARRFGAAEKPEEKKTFDQ
jgi:hypothetical protein